MTPTVRALTLYLSIVVGAGAVTAPAHAGVCDRLLGLWRRAKGFKSVGGRAKNTAEHARVVRSSTTVGPSNDDIHPDDTRTPLERRADRLILEMYFPWRATDAASDSLQRDGGRTRVGDASYRAAGRVGHRTLVERDAAHRRYRITREYARLREDSPVVRALALARVSLFDMTWAERAQVIECLNFADLEFGDYQRLPGVLRRAAPRAWSPDQSTD